MSQRSNVYPKLYNSQSITGTQPNTQITRSTLESKNTHTQMLSFYLKPRPPLRRPIHRPPHIPTPQNNRDGQDLQKEPQPPAPTLSAPIRIIVLPFPLLLPPAFIPTLGTLPPFAYVHVVRLYLYDVVIIGEFAGFGAEAEVVDWREFEGAGLETVCPFVFGFVLEFDFEGFFLEVCEADFGWY